MYGKQRAQIGATDYTMRWNKMKVIVNDNGKSLGRSVMDENSDYYEEVVPMGRVGGKYDFIMMVGDGEVYGFEGERIHFHPIGD